MRPHCQLHPFPTIKCRSRHRPCSIYEESPNRHFFSESSLHTPISTRGAFVIPSIHNTQVYLRNTNVHVNCLNLDVFQEDNRLTLNSVLLRRCIRRHVVFQGNILDDKPSCHQSPTNIQPIQIRIPVKLVNRM